MSIYKSVTGSVQDVKDANKDAKAETKPDHKFCTPRSQPQLKPPNHAILGSEARMVVLFRTTDIKFRPKDFPPFGFLANVYFKTGKNRRR